MLERYDISYDPKTRGIYDRLKSLGAGIAFNNASSGRMIALVPQEKIEELRSLDGIIDATESPLPTTP